MADTITVTYKVNEDGSLEKISKKANAAAAATDKASNASSRYNKQQKGVAGATSNSTKAFSKMTTGMTGGLVPAYATLAAHVFAVTAAFGVLSRSQAVKQLQQGLLFTGRAAGENLTIVTRNLRDITDNAISSADAMRALAVGVSAGFSEDQMEGLTKVAKGASLALGRDMTDALDRLVRGAAKLEPEILDELGIMVRLDDATGKYAASLGLAADDLSQFERRMAFTNAIIEQGTSKFGALAASVESNPFNQLAATFDDMVKSGLNFINFVVGPIAGFLAGNMAALVATMGVLGTGVVNMMVPALTQGGRASAELAQSMSDSAKATIANTKATKNSPAVFTKLSKKMIEGTASAEDLTKAQKSLVKSVAMHKKQLPGMIASHGEESETIQRKKLVIQENEAALHQLTSAQAMETLATQKAAQADILAAASAGEFKLTIKLLRAEIIRESITVKLATVDKGILATAYARVSMWAGIATLSVKAFGLALLQAIPIIGQVILGAMLLWEGVKWLFGSDAKETVSPLASVLEEGKERFAEFPNIITQMAESYELAADASERYIISLRTQSGLMKQTLTHIRDLRLAEETNRRAEISRVQGRLNAIGRERKTAEGVVAEGAGVGAQYMRRDEGWLARTIGNLMQRGIGSKSEAISVSDINEAVASLTRLGKEEEKLQTRLATLEKEVGTVSTERIEATRQAYSELAVTIQSQMDVAKKAGHESSDEFNLLKSTLDEVNGILDNLSSETIQGAEDNLTRLTDETSKTINAFSALKEAGTDVDEVFAKASKHTGIFANTLTVMDKALDSLTRTITSEAMRNEIQSTFDKYGVKDAEGLKKLRGEYKAAADFRKTQAAKERESLNTREKLNRAGLKEAALGKLQLEQENTRTKIEEEQRLAVLKGEDGVKQRLELAKLANEQEKTRIALINERVATQTRLGGSGFGAAMSVAAYGEMHGGVFDDAALSDKIRMLGDAMEPMMANLRALGPEGVLVASVASASFAIGESFTSLAEGATTTADKLQAIATVINSVAQITAAASNAKIAGIDQEIAAEKKRDGQSKASLAKIAALEKKKESAAKKSFEVNKKLQMASVVISTAAAAAAAWAPPPLGSGPLFGGFLSAAIVALGAAQLAIIAGTSYQGGGAGAIAGAGAGPSSISMGSRNNKVDISSGRGNAAGELAYLRGARGSGSGAHDFRPAFAGVRHRMGGGYVVGEQGPELFMPGVPGQIVPSGQGAGGQTNITFNISAVDAAGVEEVLIGQRGNIIGMIRESANEYGTDFLEDVETEVYTDTTEGTVYGRA